MIEEHGAPSILTTGVHNLDLVLGGGIPRGSVVMATGGGGTWDTVSPLYRQEWQRKYGTSGGRWEEYEPGYRYGYEMANDPRYRGRPGSETEPGLRADYEDWARRNHYTSEPNAWDRMKENVREAWEGVRAKVGRR